MIYEVNHNALLPDRYSPLNMMTLKNQSILWRQVPIFDNIGQNEPATPKNCQFLLRRVMTRGPIALEMVIMSIAGQDGTYME